MLLDKAEHETYDIDIKWLSEELVDLIGFRTIAGNRIKDYLKDHRIAEPQGANRLVSAFIIKYT